MRRLLVAEVESIVLSLEKRLNTLMMGWVSPEVIGLRKSWDSVLRGKYKRTRLRSDYREHKRERRKG